MNALGCWHYELGSILLGQVQVIDQSLGVVDGRLGAFGGGGTIAKSYRFVYGWRHRSDGEKCSFFASLPMLYKVGGKYTFYCTPPA